MFKTGFGTGLHRTKSFVSGVPWRALHKKGVNTNSNFVYIYCTHFDQIPPVIHHMFLWEEKLNWNNLFGGYFLLRFILIFNFFKNLIRNV